VLKTAIDTFLADWRAPVERDPAARGYVDVLLSYPGFHAVTAHRAIHALHRAGIPLLPRFLSNVARFFTQIEIHPGARLGRGVFIDHGSGVVIGETAVVGDDVTIYQGVTLGGTSLQHGKRHPTVEDGAVIGLHSAVLGAITVGAGAKVGGGSVVVKDVPPNATVVGIPARIVSLNGKPVAHDAPPRVEMPDPHAPMIQTLVERVAALEARLAKDDDAAVKMFEDVYPVI
jgi:serine O-acetyltransferase